MPPVWWPLGEVASQPEHCYSSDGEALDMAYHDSIGYPGGSYCLNECAIGFQLQLNYWPFQNRDRATCRCYDGGIGNGWCYFSQQTVNQCRPASCSPDIASLKLGLADGIRGKFVNIHDVSDVSNIEPDVNHFEKLDCPADGFWSETGNSAVDGQLKEGTVCEIKCVDGFHIERDYPQTLCWRTMIRDFEHTALTGNVSRYGLCKDNLSSKHLGSGACHDFPICVPDGYTWSE